jgi:HEAT repeat protein
MTANGLTLTVTFRVRCRYRSHNASITLTAWGAMEFFTPCFPPEVAMLPPTVRKLSDLESPCKEYLSTKVRWLAWDFFVGTAQSERACLCIPRRVRWQVREFIKQWQERPEEGAMAKLAQGGFDPPTENALRAALHSEDLHLQCAAAVLTGVQKQTSLIPDLLEIAQKQSSPCFQLAVLWALSKMPDHSVLEDFLCQNFTVQDLARALRDGSEVIQEAAARVLGRLKNVEAVPSLIRALKQTSKKVRDTARQALVSIGEPAIPHLVDTIQKKRDEEIRRAAAEVLGQIRSPRAVKPIIETLRNVRSALAIYDSLRGALVSINEPAIPVLVEALGDESPIVRQVAMESLAELQGIHISEWLKGVLAVKPLTEVLLKALKEPEKMEEIRQAATTALLSIGEPAVVSLLEALDKTGFATIEEILLQFPPDTLKKVMRKAGGRKRSLLKEILKGVHDQCR